MLVSTKEKSYMANPVHCVRSTFCFPIPENTPSKNYTMLFLVIVCTLDSKSCKENNSISSESFPNNNSVEMEPISYPNLFQFYDLMAFY